VYDARTGAETFILKGSRGLGGTAFSRDGTRIAVAPSPLGDGVVRVYDARTGEEVFALKARVPLGSAAFSRDGTRIMASGGDGVVRVYDAPHDALAWQAERRQALVDSVPAWHRTQAVQGERTGQWSATAFHWRALSKAEPASAEPHWHRGFALVNLARMTEAKTELATALALTKDADAQPASVDDNGLRYHTACVAVLADSLGAEGLHDPERVHARKQAYLWLKADLAHWARQMKSANPMDREAAQKTLTRWQTDPYLADVRDKDALVKLPESERDDWRKLWVEVRTLKPIFKIEGTLEGEHLIVLVQSGPFSVAPQNNMLDFTDQQNRWSGNSQLFGMATKVGDWADLGLPVWVDGNYRLVVYLTKAKDYGVVQFHLNGKPIGRPIDGYNEPLVTATGPIDLGPVELKAGQATLRVEVVGTNPKSVGNRYMWGLDGVLLKKE
jgi:hypothetical protein